jgi:quinolinate synthase
VQHVITPMEWPAYAPLIKAINELKKSRNAVVLAHNHDAGDLQLRRRFPRR